MYTSVFGEDQDRIMDDLGFNKIAAAVLATGLGFMGLKEIAHMSMHVEAPDVPAYALEIEEAPTPGGEVIEPPFPTPEWVAAMDADRGATVFKKCTSCHNADNGGAHGTGPNLWNVVGAAAAAKDGFNYSGAMNASGLVWSYEVLDAYLTKPTKYLQGTNMNFIGLKKAEDRAAVIEYLRVASDAPVDRPAPAVAETEEASLEDAAGTVTEVVETQVEAAEAVIVDAAEGGENTIDDAVETGEGALEEVIETGEDVADGLIEAVQDVAEDVQDAVDGDDD